eukprot:TCALIF_08097-PA protein Name:"Similar to APOD Apolipoprotein D (Cavia porcellus)" AED:0.13 eAED:0.13 QI:0/0.8/0.66/0.83/1/1/6/104/215
MIACQLVKMTAKSILARRSWLIFLVVFNLHLNVEGQEISFGRCRKFPVLKHFQADRYLGKWYEYSNYFFIFQLFGKCVTAKYTDQSNYKSQRIGVLNESINEKNGNPNSVNGIGVLEPGNAGLARLTVNFDSQPFFARQDTPNYFVVDTDYDNFSIVYNCNNKFGFLKSEVLFILTRERFPNPKLIQSVRQKIRKAGLDPTRLRRTNQKSCPYGH